MKHLNRYIGAVLLLMLCASMAQAEEIGAFVRAKCDSMRVALYGENSRLVSIHQIGFFPQRGDATRRLPQEKIDMANLMIHNIDAADDGVLIGATSSMRIDPVHTQGSTTMDVTIQEALQQGRARFLNDVTGRRCVVASQGIHEDMPCVYLMIVRRPPGTPSLVPGRQTQLTINLQGIRDTLQQLSNHERRIKALEDRPPGGILPGDIGLSGFGGYSTFSLNGTTFEGGTVGFTYRYMDFALEGYGGELFSNSRRMESSGQELWPEFSNNHFEGFSIYWAPEQSKEFVWGKYWKIGGTGMHAQRDNIENISDLEVYYAGAAATIALPFKFVTPEIWGTAGYCWTTTAANTYDTAPLKSEGFGYGLRAALVIGRR